jgi:hypothetical protein
MRAQRVRVGLRIDDDLAVGRRGGQPRSRVGDITDCGEILVAPARDVADELLATRDSDPDLERSSRRVAVADDSHERPRRFNCLLSVVRAGEPRHEETFDLIACNLAK